jgi:hypothetical protein
MKWFVVMLMLVSCHREEPIPNGCGVKNPLSDLAWLKRLNTDSGLGSSITQGTYQGQTVYAVYTCGRCFAGPSLILYRCDGSKICSGSGLDRSPNGCNQIAIGLTDKRTLVEHRP